MTGPSDYELAAWNDLIRFQGRPLSKAVRDSTTRAAATAAGVGKRAARYLDDHPRSRSMIERGSRAGTSGARGLGDGARKAAGALPEGVASWGGAALRSAGQGVSRVARAGLSSSQVVGRHRKLGHEVDVLADLRSLDLRQIDAVRSRHASLYYPAIAALSGAGAGLVISGGELTIAASSGAAAAPSGGAIAGAFVADTAAVLGLASRYVGHAALHYGYDPDEPGEKLFVMSVVNAGTAMSAGAKNAAMADISRLTQALFRGKAWAVLDKSLVAQVSKQFGSAVGARVTKQSLGKVVPAVGIGIGAAFNWATLESIVDAADVAYRRRFLLEKHPHLAENGDFVPSPASVPEDADEVISVVGQLTEMGGPDLDSTGHLGP